MTGVGIAGFRPKRGKFNFNSSYLNQDDAESFADRVRMLKQLKNPIRMSCGNHVYVLGGAPKGQIPHGTAHDPAPVAGQIQGPSHRSGRLSEGLGQALDARVLQHT
jgi:hypothetical protein